MNLKQKFTDFIVKEDHPCVMAQSVVDDNQFSITAYGSLQKDSTPKELLADLKDFLNSRSESENAFDSYIAVFPEDNFNNEDDFEVGLWSFLSRLSSLDPVAWDPNVDADPESSKFSFSLLGTAFYLVGMHPKSSRRARRFTYPAIVFNLHEQFEKLREMGAYTTVRDRIRKRDKEMNGSINPTLEDFGEASEARQYSGKKNGKEWKCLFRKIDEPWNT